MFMGCRWSVDGRSITGNATEDADDFLIRISVLYGDTQEMCAHIRSHGRCIAKEEAMFAAVPDNRGGVGPSER